MKFGRYTDAFKPKEKLDLWYKAENLFKEKKYLESYKTFFEYIRDDKEDNVHFDYSDSKIDFGFYQGSKIIKGTADNDYVKAEVNIAEFEKPGVSFMRRLLELNYQYYYSKYSFVENFICLRFTSKTFDCSPNKLYYALKEVALNADLQDDSLIEDFKMLKPITVNNVIEFPPDDKEVRYKYLHKWIIEALNVIKELNPTQYSGGITFILLNLIYKIDYLIIPQGILLHTLEKINRIYYANDNNSFEKKNGLMIAEFEKILEKPKEDIFKDLYDVRSTFPLVAPVGHQEVQNLIKGEIEKTYWYRDNRRLDIATQILEFIPTKSFFSYGLPLATRLLFHIFMIVNNEDYFREIGIDKSYYNVGKNEFNKDLLIKDIDEVIESNKSQFPNLKFDTSSLKYDSLYDFMISYLMEVSNLDYRT